MRPFFRTLLSLAVVHWLTSIGVVLTTASALVFLALVFQRFENPYVGIVVFIVLPALFILGLVLMPAGIYLAARRMGGYRAVLARVPSDPARVSRMAWAFAFATLANAGIIALAAHQGVEHMDSKEFCGQTCHVMHPHDIRYQESPHSRIPCVDCHVGSGASSFIQYKLAGARQVFRLATRTYERPIPPAILSLRPAADTCERCHASDKPREDKLRVFRHYDDDEPSTPSTTVLLMRTAKIHQAHTGRDIESPAAASRKMDCLDCHNRTGHDFETPETIVDRDIAAGKIFRSRPFARRDAVAALKAQSPFPEMNISWDTYPNNIGHERFPGCFRCHDETTATQDCSACHELLAVSEPSPDILKTLGLQ